AVLTQMFVARHQLIQGEDFVSQLIAQLFFCLDPRRQSIDAAERSPDGKVFDEVGGQFERHPYTFFLLIAKVMEHVITEIDIGYRKKRVSRDSLTNQKWVIVVTGQNADDIAVQFKIHTQQYGGEEMRQVMQAALTLQNVLAERLTHAENEISGKLDA